MSSKSKSDYQGSIVDGECLSATVILGLFDPVVTQGLNSVLRGDPQLRVAASGLSQGALESALATMTKGVVIVDESVGDKALSRLRAVDPSGRIIVFARNPTLGYGKFLCSAGLSCVASSVSRSGLIAAAHAAVNGRNLFVASDGRTAEWSETDPQLLGERERQVLRRLGRDLSYADIASDLSIGHRTVGGYTATIYQKLEVSGKREAVALFPPAWFH